MSKIICDVNSMQIVEGKLIELSGQHTVVVKHMMFDAMSKQKLKNVLEQGIVSTNEQKLVIDNFVTDGNGKDLLFEGQSPWIKNENIYSLTSKTIIRKRFSAELMAIMPVEVGSSTVGAYEIKMGNIDFDLSHSKVSQFDGGKVLFENIQMTLYSLGKYTITEIRDE